MDERSNLLFAVEHVNSAENPAMPVWPMRWPTSRMVSRAWATWDDELYIRPPSLRGFLLLPPTFDVASHSFVDLAIPSDRSLSSEHQLVLSFGFLSCSFLGLIR